MGAGDARIMLRHIFPNITAPLIVGYTLGFGGIILAEAGLSYLGVGANPSEPSWGRMLSDATDSILFSYIPSIAPESPSCSSCSPVTSSAIGCATTWTRA